MYIIVVAIAAGYMHTCIHINMGKATYDIQPDPLSTLPVLKAGPQLMMSGWGGGAKGTPLFPVDAGTPFELPSSASLSRGRERGGGSGR